MDEVSDAKVLAQSTIEIIDLSMKLDILIDTLVANGNLDKVALLEKFAKISSEEREAKFAKMLARIDGE